MSKLSFPEQVAQELVEAEHLFDIREIQHALQFRFFDGAILNVYNTGKVVWQGEKTDTKAKVEPILEKLQSANSIQIYPRRLF